MDKISIIGVNFDNITKQQALDQIEQFVKDKKFHYIVTPNPEFLLKAQKDHKFREVLNQADLSVADGAGIIFAGKYQKTPFKQRIQGTDLIIDLMPIAEKNHYKIYILGSTYQTIELTKKVLGFRHPDLEIVGADPGPIFKIQDLNNKPDIFHSIIDKINQSQADILIIAFGAPKQEMFINKFKDQLDVKIAIGIGGAFDYISGNVHRAPLLIRNIGLEWLFRLIIQPSRIKRIFNAIIIFPIYVLFSTNSHHE